MNEIFEGFKWLFKRKNNEERPIKHSVTQKNRHRKLKQLSNSLLTSLYYIEPYLIQQTIVTKQKNTNKNTV